MKFSDDTWYDFYDELVKYVAANGAADVPYRYVTEVGQFRLGAWVAAQRAQRRKGLLADDKVAELVKLRGWRWRAPRPSRAVNAERDDEIRALRAKGMSYATIGERYLLSRQRVFQICHPEAYEVGTR